MAGRALDFGIGIDKFEPELLRQPTADGGFARAHEPDENNGALAERRDDPGRSDIAHLLFATLADGFYPAGHFVDVSRRTGRFKPPFAESAASSPAQRAGVAFGARKGSVARVPGRITNH